MIDAVRLSRKQWRRILNLLKEELQFWREESAVYREITETILMIECQSGIHKKVGDTNDEKVERIIKSLRESEPPLTIPKRLQAFPFDHNSAHLPLNRKRR